jgi:inorganic pyrophosphatase
MPCSSERPAAELETGAREEINMTSTDLTRLAAWDPESGHVNVVIETPKGSRNKFKFEPKKRHFFLHGVLPVGSAFPFDFGFVPSTLGEDGDPLDLLILMDEPAFPGCLVVARLIGVIEAEQTQDGKTVRNDRLIGVEEKCSAYRDVHSLKTVSPDLLDDIEHFFSSYNEMKGASFRPLGRFGPRRAVKLIQEGMKRLHREAGDPPATGRNGPARQRKKGSHARLRK